MVEIRYRWNTECRILEGEIEEVKSRAVGKRIEGDPGNSLIGESRGMVGMLHYQGEGQKQRLVCYLEQRMQMLDAQSGSRVIHLATLRFSYLYKPSKITYLYPLRGSMKVGRGHT